MDNDPFGDLLVLENQFYKEGYILGVKDGSRAGLVEGRFFGLEKGFDKFVKMGKIHGLVIVWANRLPASQRYGQSYASYEYNDTTEHWQENSRREDNSDKEEEVHAVALNSLPDLPKAERLTKHVHTLYALIEPSSLSTDNNEDAVSDSDDRLKRAQGKTKIIERTIAKSKASTYMKDEMYNAQDHKGGGSIEDVHTRH